jgi:hypothetical protein
MIKINIENSFYSAFIQSEHPNVSASVKTSAAIQKLLNYSKNMVRI